MLVISLDTLDGTSKDFNLDDISSAVVLVDASGTPNGIAVFFLDGTNIVIPYTEKNRIALRQKLIVRKIPPVAPEPDPPESSDSFKP